MIPLTNYKRYPDIVPCKNLLPAFIFKYPVKMKIIKIKSLKYLLIFIPLFSYSQGIVTDWQRSSGGFDTESMSQRGQCAFDSKNIYRKVIQLILNGRGVDLACLFNKSYK